MPITAQKPQNGSSFGWPVGQNQFSKPKFVDTFHPQNRPRKPPPPAYNSLPISKSAEVVSKVSMNGPVPTAATEKVKNQVLPSKPHSTILACSLLPTLICGHVKKLIGIPQSSSLPRLTKSKSGKIQSAKNSKPNISSRSLSQIPTLSKSRNSESNGTNVSNKSDENVSKSAIERRTKFAGIKSMGAAQAKRSLSMAEETRNRSGNVSSR
ncbi:hypothetical protein Ddc_16059 [Ditylenchus destructor]|nr:hypothetical protein Ddc_16059 [Ditylenchus destructor]